MSCFICIIILPELDLGPCCRETQGEVAQCWLHACFQSCLTSTDPADVPWALVYTARHSIAHWGLNTHPSQPGWGCVAAGVPPGDFVGARQGHCPASARIPWVIERLPVPSLLPSHLRGQDLVDSFMEPCQSTSPLAMTSRCLSPAHHCCCSPSVAPLALGWRPLLPPLGRQASTQKSLQHHYSHKHSPSAAADRAQCPSITGRGSSFPLSSGWSLQAVQCKLPGPGCSQGLFPQPRAPILGLLGPCGSCWCSHCSMLPETQRAQCIQPPVPATTASSQAACNRSLGQNFLPSL